MRTDHFFVELHRRWERFGVPAENIPKVHVDEVPLLREEEVVEMSVSHSQEIGDHTVPSCVCGVWVCVCVCVCVWVVWGVHVLEMCVWYGGIDV